MYSLGVCFAAYASAEALHGSGFLACFAAGMIIAVSDPELCDCFVEYGETTAELLLMFTFVLLGGSLIWMGLSGVTIALAVFVFLALFARSFALLPALSLMGLDRASKLTIAWFGPRGLSTLLLILLVVFAGLPGGERLFQICALTVLASIVVHGGSITALGRKRPSGHSPQLRVTDPVLLRVEEIDTLRAAGADVVLVDVRSNRAYAGSSDEIEEALRFDPENPVRSAELSGIAKDAWPALFCT
jgi:NhaP-type Na+/H+ and K+/H+ antiporter